MEKLAMCRICLVQDVRMYVVVNKNLQELYEKLTDVPFVTEDRRPMLACFFCCTKLKQCCRFLRKCLEAEELFSQILSEAYERDPLINPGHMKFLKGFSNSPIEIISIVGDGQTESDAIKEELPGVSAGLDDIIEPKEEPQTDELNLENVDKSYPDVKVSPVHYAESDPEYEVPLLEIKTEVEDEQESIGSDTDSEYEIGAPGPSTKKKLRTEIVHKKCVTTYSRQDFEPSETQSTDNECRRGSPLLIIGDIVMEHDNNYQMEVDDENPTIDHVQTPRQIIGVRLNKAPKTSAERAREFRARKALLKQQSKQQQQPDAIVELAAENIRSAGQSEDLKRAKSAEATRRWREKKKGVSESSKKQAKTAAQRMREYRERKKLAKKMQLKQQSDQD